MPGIAMLTMPDEFDPYYLHPRIAGQLKKHKQYGVVTLQAIITHLGDVLPDAGQAGQQWLRGEHAQRGRDCEAWLGTPGGEPETAEYDVVQPDGGVDPPIWPTDVKFVDIVNAALRDRLILTMDHRPVKNIRGDLK